jgi:hypothetical protein
MKLALVLTLVVACCAIAFSLRASSAVLSASGKVFDSIVQARTALAKGDTVAAATGIEEAFLSDKNLNTWIGLSRAALLAAGVSTGAFFTLLASYAVKKPNQPLEPTAPSARG